MPPKPRPFTVRSRREAWVDALPALSIFGGAVIASIAAILDPTTLLSPSSFVSVGGTILFLSVILGFTLRWLIPREKAPERRPQTYDLVIFDCDGVLVDSEFLSVELEARILTELGWPITPVEVARRWVGRSGTAQRAEVADRLGEEAAAEFARRSSTEIRRVFERSLVPVAGVRAVLDHLDDIEMPYCVASSSSHDRIRTALSITGLMGRFAGQIHSADDVDRGKPAPDVFLRAAKKAQAEPARCVVIEDSVPGVEAGVAAGMTVLGYAGGLTEARDLAAAGATVFHDMADLVGLLGAADPMDQST